MLLLARFFTAPLLLAHKVYQFVRIKSVSLLAIQSSSPSSCQAGSNCQVLFSGILIPPKCNTDLNIGFVTAAGAWQHPVFHSLPVDNGGVSVYVACRISQIPHANICPQLQPRLFCPRTGSHRGLRRALRICQLEKSGVLGRGREVLQRVPVRAHVRGKQRWGLQPQCEGRHGGFFEPRRDILQPLQSPPHSKQPLLRQFIVSNNPQPHHVQPAVVRL